jgi:hypothetical protein
LAATKLPLLQGEGRGEDGFDADSARPIPTLNPPLEGEETHLVAQILGYLKSARIGHGLLINFGSYKFEIRKYAWSVSKKATTQVDLKERKEKNQHASF